jgi:hypothetical protein
MKIKRKGLSRRALLRGMGGLAVSLPFLEIMRRPRPARAGGLGGFPKRLVVWYTPNGTIPGNFWPTGGETNFALSPILEPLQPHKQDLLILGGIDMLSALNGPGDAHQKGTGQCLTATELQEGDFPGDAGLSAGWANHASIDQYVAARIGGETIYPSLELGVAVQGSDVGARISYRGPGQPVPSENSPYVMFDRLFGEAAADPAALQRKVARRQAVLDAVSGQYSALRDRLGADDRQKLEIHLQAVDDIQTRLAKGVVEFGGECQPLDQGAPLDPERVSNMPAIGKLQMDLLAMAFACDLTRVGTIMWTRSAANHVLNWADENILEGHHSLAHKGDEDAVKIAQNTNVNRWYAEQFGYLIQKLKSIPEGTGTVFDNTVILWTNEQAKGNNHDRRGMPYVLAGSAGGYFNTGRYVTQTQETGHNKLLVSVMNAMDIEGDTFGNPEYGTGPLPGLT